MTVSLAKLHIPDLHSLSTYYGLMPSVHLWFGGKGQAEKTVESGLPRQHEEGLRWYRRPGYLYNSEGLSHLM